MPNFPFQVCGTRKVYQVTMLFLLRGFHMEHQDVITFLQVFKISDALHYM